MIRGEQPMMRRVSIDRLVPETPTGHWDVVSRTVVDGRPLRLQVCEMGSDGGATAHAHDEQDQIFFLLEGALDVEGPGAETVTVRAGEALLIPAGCTHATVNHGRETARYLVLTLPTAT